MDIDGDVALTHGDMCGQAGTRYIRGSPGDRSYKSDQRTGPSCTHNDIARSPITYGHNNRGVEGNEYDDDDDAGDDGGDKTSRVRSQQQTWMGLSTHDME